jgi:hypothetical protein
MSGTGTHLRQSQATRRQPAIHQVADLLLCAGSVAQSGDRDGIRGDPDRDGRPGGVGDGADRGDGVTVEVQDVGRFPRIEVRHGQGQAGKSPGNAYPNLGTPKAWSPGSRNGLAGVDYATFLHHTAGRHRGEPRALQSPLQCALRCLWDFAVRKEVSELAALELSLSGVPLRSGEGT